MPDESPPLRVPFLLLVVVLLVGSAVLGCDPADEPTEGAPPVPDPETTPVPPTTSPAEGLCLATIDCGGSILDDPKAPCRLQVTSADGTVDYDGAAGIELRGRSSLWFPKPSYGVELRDHQELPVWPGAQWRYLDDGTDPGTGWTGAGFDDTAWPTGPAPLGVAVDWLQTELSAGGGPDGRSVTRYFRRTFEVASPTDVSRLVIGLKRQDGAAVYVDGVEVLRDNLPVGAGHATPADGPDAGTGWTTVELDPGLLAPGPTVIAVEVHAAGAVADGMRFDLYVEATGDDRSASLLGMGAEEDWILDGLYADRVLFRNRLASDVFQGFGPERYAADTRFCELVLNGEPAGLYALGEALDRDDDRIDIGDGGDTGASFIVKLGDDGGFHDNAVGYGTWELVFPDPSPSVERAVAATLVGWEDAVLGPDPADPTTGIFAWIDLDSAVDWVLVQELLKNPDGYQLSVRLWQDEGGKMHFAPWDFDLSMAGYPDSDCSAEGWVPRATWTPQGERIPARYVEAMASVPAFRARLVERWKELRPLGLSLESLRARIAGYDATLAPGLDANLALWPTAEVSFETGSGSSAAALCPVETWVEEHERVLGFLEARVAWMDEHLEEF
jgi:hypothetical protein